jgi:hypothetical protein
MQQPFAPVMGNILPLARWLELHPGMVSLMTACSQASPFAGGLRVVALQNGDALVAARVCECGPESHVASIQDWAGGYRLSVAGPGGSAAALRPIPSEHAVTATLHAMGNSLALRGMPAALTEFAPGGKLFSAAFTPLLPTVLNFDNESMMPIIKAAEQASESSTRISQGALVPDAVHLKLPVYDLRLVEPNLLERLVQAAGADVDQVKPLLVLQTCMGGSSHYLLVDGVQGSLACITWARAPGENSFEHNVWPNQVAVVEEAPVFLADRTQPTAAQFN